MISESFAFGSSPLHKMDPRLKIVAATVFSFQAALSEDFATLACALAFGISLSALARLEIGAVAKRLLLVNGFVFLFWVMLPLTFPGQPLFSMGPLDFTLPGVLLAAQITLKSNAIVLALIALAGTSSLADLGWAMHRLKVPDKLVYLLLLTYRYVFVIEQEYQRLIRAARVRNFEPGTNLHTYKTYAYLVGMLFVRAAARAERVYHAMVCRGFAGKFNSPREFVFSRSDTVWSVFLGGVFIVLGYLEWAKTTLF
jgi:cobalt/nickel transport system permease protein